MSKNFCPSHPNCTPLLAYQLSWEIRIRNNNNNNYNSNNTKTTSEQHNQKIWGAQGVIHNIGLCTTLCVSSNNEQNKVLALDLREEKDEKEVQHWRSNTRVAYM